MPTVLPPTDAGDQKIFTVNKMLKSNIFDKKSDLWQLSFLIFDVAKRKIEFVVGWDGGRKMNFRDFLTS